MHASSVFVTCGLALLQTLVAGSAIPHYFQDSQFTRRDLSIQKVQRELGPLLSKGSSIFGPTDSRWGNVTERFNAYAYPTIRLVVQPAKEADISTIVRYSNRNSIDFLTVNRGHGWTTTVGSFKGMQIDMGLLTSITIQKDKKTAWFQGGTWDGQVIDYLYERGFEATTGACSCVGMLGPGLGGGHGRFEGQYGMIADNIVNLNVVLADGSAIRVSSKEHSDLFWAMQGAGHNFGIVTSFELKIYPRKVETWHFHNYLWTQDKLELIFETLNKFHNNGNTPVKMAVNYGEMSIHPEYSLTEAAIGWTFAYAGPADEAEKMLAPFNAIGSLGDQVGDVPYNQLPTMQGTASESPSCQPNRSFEIITVGLVQYNVSTQRTVYNLYNKMVNKYPGWKAGTQVFYEGYANAAAKKVPAASTAYPHRDDNHLLYFAAEFEKGSNLTTVAREWTREVRDIWNAGQNRKPSTYVNYASGDETLESTYGYEPWRLARLRGLKAKYDPFNRFRYYNPIIRDSHNNYPGHW